MTTSTLPLNRRSTFFARHLGNASRTYVAESKSKPGKKALIVEAKPVFRSGTFRDSMGEETTWDKSHMDQMVFHYSLLSGNGVFSDVPVRKGHPDRGGIFGGESRNVMDELVGYVTALRAEDRVNPIDSQTYTYLLADFEILDPEGIEKIDSGLWRNVSAEIAPTYTNNNAEYWPVFSGVAYVDRPAVEGLKAHAAATHQITVITEEDMTTTPSAGPAIPAAPAAPTAGPTTDNSAATTTASTAATTAPVAPIAFAAPAAPAAPAASAAPHVFTIAGQQVTDFAAVQEVLNEVVDLRNFRQAAEDSAREQFVDGLVQRNQIAVTQKDDALAYVKGLDTDQFAAYSKLVGGAPTIGMLANHGATHNTPQAYAAAATGQPQPGDVQAHRVKVLKGQLQTHKLGGMSVEKMQKLPSYAELRGIDPNFDLASI